MQIAISERLRPFSHRAGSSLLIPGTSLAARIYPTYLEIKELTNGETIAELDLNVGGPVETFTVQLDLERARVRVWGEAREGFYRYTLHAGGLHVEKGPANLFGGQKSLAFGAADEEIEVGTVERLSLGCHRKQNWEQVMRRRDLTEILPVWHRLGLMTATGGGLPTDPSLLSVAQEAEPLDLVEALTQLFRAGFSSLLLPSARDRLHLGLDHPPLPPGSDPLHLLTDGSRLIRSLFIAERDGHLSLLPKLPPQFHAGRMTGVATSLGPLDFEWTKKSLRRLHLRATRDGELTLTAPKVTRCRLQKGTRLDLATPINVSQGERIQLDHFE